MDNPNSKTARFRFAHQGMIIREAPDLLSDGQYRYLLNCYPNREGSLSSRIGCKQVGQLSGATLRTPYFVRKLVVTLGENPLVPSTNPRYLGILTSGAARNIYRTTDYVSTTLVGSSVDSAASRHWEMADYSAGASGNPWAFFACPNKMLKDRGASPYSTLPTWGILPAYGVATWTDGGAGNLDGGDAGSPADSQPYDWVYTYLNGDTGNEGNPSQSMMTTSGIAGGTPAAVHLRQAVVTVYGTDDAQVSSIAVYRRGGTLTDGIYRQVGVVANPGLNATTTFADNVADTELVLVSKQAEFDNDPPVTSTVIKPIITAVSAIGGSNPGVATITPADASILTRLTRGTLVHFYGPNAQQDAVIQAIGGSTFTVYLQVAQANSDTIEVDAITAQPCNLAINIGDAIAVAGDPNNPHVLYKSKQSRPESFPVGTDATGAVTSVGVGSPSNGIINMCFFRGQIITLNQHSLFYVALINGSLFQPAEVAKKGLAAQSAWCQTEDEIWFLSAEGTIWSFDGGTLTNRSSALDPIFNNQAFEGFNPVDLSATGLAYIRMEYRRGMVWFLYLDTSGDTKVMVCEPQMGYRWTPWDIDNITFPLKTLYTEPDTQSLILAWDTSSSTVGAIYGIDDASAQVSSHNGTSDIWTSAPTDGFGISYTIKTPWFDLGDPTTTKIFEEAWLDCDPALSTGIYAHDPTLTVKVLLDFSETPVDTLTIAAPSSDTIDGRQLLSILPNLAIGGGLLQSFSRGARAISFQIEGSAFPYQPTFYALVIQYQDAGIQTAGGATDWSDLGYGHDKRLYQLTVEFDVAGVNRTLVMDTVTGIKGNTYTLDAQTFTLSNATTSGPGRAKCTFPVADNTIVKLVRLRPVATASAAGKLSNTFFRVLSFAFEKEDYPPDIVSFTEWDTGGYDYLKYLNQLTLEVDTNNVAVTYKLQADNSDQFTATVTATSADRVRDITIPTGLTGRQWRIFVDASQSAIVSGGGKFQLFNPKGMFRFQPADKGEVMHTFDWDDLGHPWDKYLRTVTVEWDNTGGSNVTMQLDTINGIGGVTLNSNVLQFTLGTSGRGKLTVPIPADTIAKLIRIYPVGGTIPAGYRQWRYSFDKIDYPADIVDSTEWKGAGTDEECQFFWIDADTGGVAATVVLVNENGTVTTVSHTGTATNRRKDYPTPLDTVGKMWRLTVTIGGGGKFQLFGWGVEHWSDISSSASPQPPDTVLWTPYKDFDWPFDKIGRNVVVEADTGGSNVTFVLQADDINSNPITVNGTENNRQTINTITPDFIGKLWRLVVTSSVPSKFKLWKWQLDFIKEPPATSTFDSYEQYFGNPGFKFMKQFWIEYQSTDEVTVTVSVANDQVLSQNTLPAHAHRDSERFYLPTVSNIGTKNKSKVYRILVTCNSPFKVYGDGSWIEYIDTGANRRESYQRVALSEFMALQL